MAVERRRVLRVGVALALVLALAVVLWLAVFHRHGEGGALVASGTVEATEAHLGFRAPGRIDTILVREGDRVRAGEELARLDQAEALAGREEARARVAAARAQLAELERGFRSEDIAKGRAQVAAAAARLADAERDLDRAQRLYDGGAVSREALDKATAARDVARADSEQAGEELRRLKAGPRREQIDAQRAALASAEGALAAADALVENTTIVAPFDGIVTVREGEPGEVVPAGAAVLTVMNPEDRWVRIFIREDEIGAVHLGTPARITSDTYPGQRYEGAASFIASQAEFTPKNVQTTGERVKLVYAVKVRITSDSAFVLKPGMPADVRLDVRR